MSNTVLNDLGYAYDPYFYGNRAITQLEKNLVFAGSVYRGYDRNVGERGQYINIRKPDTFVVNDAPSAAQDVDPENIQIQLNQWKEVKFKLTDKELTLGAEPLIMEHIDRAAYALAAYVDQQVAGLGEDIPWYQDLSSTPAVGDITASRRILSQNNVPVFDQNNMFLMLDPLATEGFLNLTAFSQNQGAGDVGVNTQLTGSLGRKFGFNTFETQNIQNHTTGSASTTTLALNGAATARSTVVNIDAGSVTGTLAKGDVITFAGHSQKYAITGTKTASSNAFTAVGISPPLAVDVADNVVITLVQDTHSMNLAYHRDAFALAMAPLSDAASGLGVRVGTVTRNNISIRSRVYAMPDTSQIAVALDVLFGIKTLDANKAVRLRG